MVQPPGSTSITELPAGWPAADRDHVERRLKLIATNKAIGLIERPEFKRRWNVTPWEEQLEAALRDWLLDRLEVHSYPTGGKLRLFSVSELAERARTDADFVRVAERFSGRPDFDLGTLIADLMVVKRVY